MKRRKFVKLATIATGLLIMSDLLAKSQESYLARII